MNQKNKISITVTAAVLLFFVFIAITMATATAGPGGGWVSSGGELFKDAKNPWFVHNTNQVSYCLNVDVATVSAPEPVIRQMVTEAITYWKTEFSKSERHNRDSTFARIATQNFTEETCGESTDLRFLIGFGSLSRKEIEYLGDPQKYVGVSVRTSYDTTNLRARGFVFISSDKGPLAYHNPGHLVAEAWKEPLLLKYALIHEMGHIFGIPHTGAGLMSETFLDQVLHTKFSGIYLRYPIEPYLYPPSEFEVCEGIGVNFHRDFFQLTGTERCLVFREFKSNLHSFAWKVFKKQNITAPEIEIGEVLGTSSLEDISSSQPSLTLHLPPEQSVFSKKEARFMNFILGPPITSYGFNGFFRTVNSKQPHHVIMRLSPTSVTLIGTAQGRVTPVMSYSLPTLLQKLSAIPL